MVDSRLCKPSLQAAKREVLTLATYIHKTSGTSQGHSLCNSASALQRCDRVTLCAAQF